MRDKELTSASPYLAVCRILIATFKRLMNKPHSHKTKKSLVEPSPRGWRAVEAEGCVRTPEGACASTWNVAPNCF